MVAQPKPQKVTVKNVKNIKYTNHIRPKIEFEFENGKSATLKDFTHFHYQFKVGRSVGIDFIDITDVGLRPSKSTFNKIFMPAKQCDIFKQSWKLKIECQG